MKLSQIQRINGWLTCWRLTSEASSLRMKRMVGCPRLPHSCFPPSPPIRSSANLLFRYVPSRPYGSLAMLDYFLSGGYEDSFGEFLWCAVAY